MNRPRRIFLAGLFCLLLLLLLASCSNTIVTPSDTNDTVTPAEVTGSDLPTDPGSVTNTPAGTETPVSTVTETANSDTAIASEPDVTTETPSSANTETTAVANTGTAGTDPVTSVPDTSALPITTKSDVTEQNPVTSAEPLTTAEPVSTVTPATSAEPITTKAPETTVSPVTSPTPETTRAPETTAAPVTSSAPETTAVPETTVDPESTSSPLPDFTDPDKYASDYAYQQLAVYEHSSAMQSFYRELAAAAKEFHKNNPDCTNQPKYGTDSLQTMLGNKGMAQPQDYCIAFELPLPKDLSPKDLSVVAFSFRLDHPLYYWMSSVSFYYSYGPLTQYPVLCDSRYYSGESRSVLNASVYAQCEAWYRSVDGKNAYGAAKSAHDLICNTIEYKYESSGDPDTTDVAHSVAGFFAKSDGVCECYAKTFQLFMTLRNIPCISVYNIDHMWNLLQLDDGGWYWVDVTFDDFPNMYVYFCKNDTEDIWTGSGYQKPTDDSTFFGGDNHTVLPPGGPETEYENQTYAELQIYFIYDLPQRSAAPYSGPKE